MTRNLKLGAVGSDVTLLQQRLTAAGYPANPDGWFGDKTRAAVLDYQRDHLITMTGTAGPRTLASLLGAASDKQLTITHLRAAAAQLGVSVAKLAAFADVESAGEGFDSAGRPVVLFERHVFHRQIAAHLGQAKADALAAAYPQLCNPQRGGYVGGAGEWQRLTMAMGLHRAAAIESASWGMFQVMGYHWQANGMADAEAWRAAMCQSEADQLAAVVGFIGRDAKLLAALQAGNWKEVARRYNGQAYADNRYDQRLAAAHRHFAVIYPDEVSHVD